MKKLLLILICFFVFFEVKSKDLILTCNETNKDTVVFLDGIPVLDHPYTKKNEKVKYTHIFKFNEQNETFEDVCNVEVCKEYKENLDQKIKITPEFIHRKQKYEFINRFYDKKLSINRYSGDYRLKSTTSKDNNYKDYVSSTFSGKCDIYDKKKF